LSFAEVPSIKLFEEQAVALKEKVLEVLEKLEQKFGGDRIL